MSCLMPAFQSALFSLEGFFNILDGMLLVQVSRIGCIEYRKREIF